jgi:hypothetical protein
LLDLKPASSAGDQYADFEQTTACLPRHRSISKKAGKVKKKTRDLIFSANFRTFKVCHFAETILYKE